jgi:signal transduction histidine kinase
VPRLARGEFNEQFRIFRPDTTVRWVNYRTFPVRNEQGEVYRVAAIAEDITERKGAEEKLAANAVELQQMVEVLRAVEDELRSNNAALNEARQELERRVQERTADLRAANAELHRQITERRRLENELLDITEKERRRIGIDLHDDLGQHLNGIALLVEALKLKLSNKESPEVADVDRIKGLLLKTMNHAHGVARDLASADLKSRELSTALKDLAVHAESLFGIKCLLSMEGEIPTVPEAVVSQLYKIAQEAVTNAIKHGKAKEVQISMTQLDGNLVMRVRNDGEPFPETISMSNRMGLRIMNYRANTLGAKLEIKGEDKRGTVVTCSMPMHSCLQEATNN